MWSRNIIGIWAIAAGLYFPSVGYAVTLPPPPNCKLEIKNRIQEFLRPKEQNKYKEWLSNDQTTGAQIIGHLSHDPELAAYYSASAGVDEGYSVEKHTLDVFKLFEEQFPQWKVSIKGESGSDLRALLKATIALHDIGKPNAIKAGSKFFQHEYTLPILEQTLAKMDFSPREIEIAKALVGNDYIGEAAKYLRGGPGAVSRLALIADRLQIPREQFVRLQEFFFTIDAGSYPKLRANYGRYSKQKLTFQWSTRYTYEEALKNIGKEKIPLLPSEPYLPNTFLQKQMSPAEFKAALGKNPTIKTRVEGSNFDLQKIDAHLDSLAKRDPAFSKPGLLHDEIKLLAAIRQLSGANILRPNKNPYELAQISMESMEEISTAFQLPGGFKNQIRELALNPLLDDLLSYNMTVDQARGRIHQIAQDLGMSDHDVLESLILFHSLDSGDEIYRSLESGVKLSNKDAQAQLDRVDQLRRAVTHPESAVVQRPLTDPKLSPTLQAKQILARQEGIAQKLFPSTGFSDLQSFRQGLEEASEGPSTRSKKLKSLWGDVKDEKLDLRINIDPQKLASVLEHGYRNEFEGVGTGINSNTGGRQALESSHLAADIDSVMTMDPRARPHYAVVGPSFRRPMETENISPPGFNGFEDERQLHDAYGSAVIIVNPKKVADRLTWTPGDSANRLQSATVGTGNGKLVYHAPEAIDQIFIPWNERELMLPYLISPVESHSTFAARDPDPSSLPEGLKPFHSSWKTAGLGTTNYIEAQIWGDVPPDLIEAIELVRGTVSPEALAAIQAAAQKHGIEIRWIEPSGKWKPTVSN